MTFLFLDRVAGLVGSPDDLLAAARARLFREPVRHDGLRRLPRPEVRAHVAGVVVCAANERLRGPLVEAVTAHAQEAGDAHEMMTGEEPGTDGYRDAVVAAFAGNDVGIDMAVFGDGEAHPDAVADQVLADVAPGVADAFLRQFGVPDAAVEAMVDEVLAPLMPEKVDANFWSLERIAASVIAADIFDVGKEAVQYILTSGDPELQDTGMTLIGIVGAWRDALKEWLDERAMLSSPEQDEADVAEVLRLVNQEGAQPAASAYARLPSADEALDAIDVDKVRAAVPRPPAPIAAEPSDVTRAVTAALRCLFEMTVETDTHVAEVLGVPKAVVAQARKDVAPWSPDPARLGALAALVGRYNDALAAAAGALGGLDAKHYEEKI